jgi:hypothetical protein
MTNAFKYLTSVLFVAVVVQVALAGYGVFYALHKTDDGGAVDKDAFEHGFNAHAILGTLLLVVMLLLVFVAAWGRLGPVALKFSVGLLVAGILQLVFAELGRSVPALGFLHVVNALAIYAAAAMLAQRAWMRGMGTAPSPAA